LLQAEETTTAFLMPQIALGFQMRELDAEPWFSYIALRDNRNQRRE
jgi:hypothetical protein